MGGVAVDGAAQAVVVGQGREVGPAGGGCDVARRHTGPAALWQRILNERPIPPRHLQNITRMPIPVTARMVWERDGVELVDTVAVDWVGRDVLVRVTGPRRQTSGVWLDAADVRRR